MVKSMIRTLGTHFGMIAAALVCALAASVAMADTVSLRTSAVVAQRDRGVRLADIARLDGADAQALSELVVVDASTVASKQSAWLEVGIDSVRSAMKGAGANMGRIAISGATCLVRIDAPKSVEPTSTQAEEKPAEQVGQVVEPEALPTIRGRVAEALADLFGVSRSELRLKFDPRDDALLAQTEWGRRVAVQPASGTTSSRVVVEVRIYLGERLIESRSVRVDVEIRRRVVTLLQTVQRKAELTADVLSESVQWLAPGGAAPIGSITLAVGSVARTRLDAGSVLRESEIEAAIAIRRNELVTVHCLRAGFEVRTRARASRDAAVGDVIEFTLEGSRRPFMARVDAPGRAVVDLDRAGPLASASSRESSR